jgi:hypothetical protein
MSTAGYPKVLYNSVIGKLWCDMAPSIADMIYPVPGGN